MNSSSENSENFDALADAFNGGTMKSTFKNRIIPRTTLSSVFMISADENERLQNKNILSYVDHFLLSLHEHEQLVLLTS